MERPIITASYKKSTRPFRCALGRRSPDPTPQAGQIPPAARLSERGALPTADMIDDARFIFVSLSITGAIILTAPYWLPVFL